MLEICIEIDIKIYQGMFLCWCRFFDRGVLGWHDSQPESCKLPFLGWWSLVRLVLAFVGKYRVPKISSNPMVDHGISCWFILWVMDSHAWCCASKLPLTRWGEISWRHPRMSHVETCFLWLENHSGGINNKSGRLSLKRGSSQLSQWWGYSWGNPSIPAATTKGGMVKTIPNRRGSEAKRIGIDDPILRIPVHQQSWWSVSELSWPSVIARMIGNTLLKWPWWKLGETCPRQNCGLCGFRRSPSVALWYHAEFHLSRHFLAWLLCLAAWKRR